jgi:predicted short-subunit dehydrogenase-like oxidoreductase (DUF2520 family)
MAMMSERTRHFRLGLLGVGAAARGVLPALQGTGLVDLAFAADPAHAGETLAGQTVRDEAPEPLGADLLLLAVREAQLPGLVDRLARRLERENLPGRIVLQVSASAPLAGLEPLSRAGVLAGLLHPLQTFPPGVPPPEQIPFWALGGDAALRQELAPLLGILADEWLWLEPQDQLPYHLSAVLACNFLPAMASLCRRLWPGDPAQAWRALQPIVGQTLRNLAAGPPELAVSGPATRGDQVTMERHLAWLADHHPALVTVYEQLSGEILSLRTDRMNAALLDVAKEE